MAKRAEVAFQSNSDLMLVVSRLKDQSMMIGDDLMVTLAEIQANRVLLVMSHKSGDRIMFWEESARQWMDADMSMAVASGIFVTVVDIKDARVRLGFECPREMTVHRKEVYDLIHPFK